MVLRHRTMFAKSSLHGISFGNVSKRIVSDGPGKRQVSVRSENAEAKSFSLRFRSDLKLYRDDPEIKYSKTLDSCKIPQVIGVDVSREDLIDESLFADSSRHSRTPLRTSGRFTIPLDRLSQHVSSHLSVVHGRVHGDGKPD